MAKHKPLTEKQGYEEDVYQHPLQRAFEKMQERKQATYDADYGTDPTQKPSLPEVGDRVKFKAMTIYGHEWGWRKVRKVDTDNRTIYVKFWGCNEFALDDFEILEVDKEYYKNRKLRYGHE